MDDWKKAAEVYLVSCKTRIRVKAYQCDPEWDIPQPGRIDIMPEVVGAIIEWLNDEVKAGGPAEAIDTTGRRNFVWDENTGGVTVAYTNNVQDYEAPPAEMWARETQAGLELRLVYDGFEDRKSYRGDYLVTWTPEDAPTP